MSSNSAHGELSKYTRYNIGGFLRVPWFPPIIKPTATRIDWGTQRFLRIDWGTQRFLRIDWGTQRFLRIDWGTQRFLRIHGKGYGYGSNAIFNSNLFLRIAVFPNLFKIRYLLDLF
jgi:hypothetical protein